MSEMSEVIEFIIKEIRGVMPETSDKEAEKIQSMLRKASKEEILRVADMFYRFDAKTIFEILTEKENKYEALDNATC